MQNNHDYSSRFELENARINMNKNVNRTIDYHDGRARSVEGGLRNYGLSFLKATHQAFKGFHNSTNVKT